MNESEIWKRVKLTRQGGFHMLQDVIGNIELDVIQKNETTKIENGILLHISLDIRFWSQDIIDKDK
jgi:hypothetical protein